MTQVSQTRYTRVAILLHWAIAALIAFNLSLGFFMEGFAQPARGLFVLLHISSGLTVLALTAVRIVWRLLNPPPPYSDDMKPIEQKVAHVAHFLLYAAMVLMPLTGWGIVSAHPAPGTPGFAADMARKMAKAPPPPPAAPGQSTPKPPKMVMKIWFLIPMPSITPLQDVGREPEGLKAQDHLHEQFVNWHAIGAWLTIALLLLHIAGALKHQFIDRHPELQRMGLGRGKEGQHG